MRWQALERSTKKLKASVYNNNNNNNNNNGSVTGIILPIEYDLCIVKLTINN